MNLKKYIAELKKRNVFKAAIAYLITAWLITQVADIVFPTFNAPPYLMKILLFILSIGFPIILVFSWVYDITTEGIKKTDSIDQESQKANIKNSRLNKVIIASLSIAVLLLLFNQFWKTSSNKLEKLEGIEITEPIVTVEKSIAVLPFNNMSSDPDNEYFCDGMTTAVISRLSKINGISKVIPFTSIRSYKHTQKTIPEIASELKVTHILESSFQKSGNDIKINLHLIDGPSNKLFWSDEYLGKYDNIFKIQADVAENVAKKMDVEITDLEMNLIQKIPTNNKEAYNLYLQAQFQFNKFNKIAFSNAIPLYQNAIALDSNFTEAYIGLANVWILGGLVWGIYKEQTAWKNAKHLLKEALNYDSTNILVKDALYSGYFYYEWNFDLVEEYYQVKKKLPIISNVVSIEIDYPVKTGKFTEALLLIDKRILFDPSIGSHYGHKAEILRYLGKKNEVINFLEKYDKLYMDNSFYLREAAKNYYYLKEYEKSKKHVKKLLENFTDRPSILYWLSAVYQNMDGNDEGVAENLNELNKMYDDGTSGSPAWFIALYYCHIKDYENAFVWLQKSFDHHEVEILWFREEPLLIPLREDVRYKELYSKIGFPKRE